MTRTIAPLLIALTLGCSEERQTSPLVHSDEVLRWEPPIQVFENRDVINVYPVVKIDPYGGFLVADQGEQQVRRYEQTGDLLWYFGRNGDGPTEYRRMADVARLPGGQILVAESRERVDIWNAEGDSIERRHRLPLQGISQIEALDDSTLLVSGIPIGEPEGPRLHRINVRTLEIESSFFSPFDSERATVGLTAGWSSFSLRGDTIAATFSITDSVYFFNRAGEDLGGAAVPSAYFRRADGSVNPRDLQSPTRRVAWLTSFDLIERAFWDDSGTLLVAYQNMIPGTALDRQHHLVRMSPEGEGIWELRDTPRLIEVNERGLLFVAQNAEAPNQWQYAHYQ